jgi:DNA-binding NarL/FixJ family response regulator
MMGGSEAVGQPAGRCSWPRPLFAPDAGAIPVASVRNEKVLIVEDDHLVAIEAESALLDAGFAIAGIAATSEEAVSLARTEKPDIVVMDIRLAGKRDGIDTAIQLFTESGLRSVFASAHSDSASRPAPKQLGR